MVIDWGKCTIFIQKLDGSNAAEAAGWTKLPTPKEDTTELTTTAGDTMEATEEGGALVDRAQKASTYELAYGLFHKKGQAQPLVAINGIVPGDYAVALQPEDTASTGIYMGRTSIATEDTYTAADGGLTTYTHAAKVPDGDTTAKVTVDGTDYYQQMIRKVITATADTGGSTYSLAFADPA